MSPLLLPCIVQESGNSSLPKWGFEVALADEKRASPAGRSACAPPSSRTPPLQPDLESAAAQQKVPEVVVCLQGSSPTTSPSSRPSVRVRSPALRLPHGAHHGGGEHLHGAAHGQRGGALRTPWRL